MVKTDDDQFADLYGVSGLSGYIHQFTYFMDMFQFGTVFSHLMKFSNGLVLKIFSGSFSEKCSIKKCRKISSSFIGILLAGFCRVLGFQQKSRSGQTKFLESSNLI